MTEATAEALQNGDSSRPGFLTTFYDTLFHPVSAFRTWREEASTNNRMLTHALIAVILISGITPLTKMASTGGDPMALVLAVPTSAVVGVAVWGLMGLIIGLLSYAYTGQAHIRTFLSLSGLATLPWIFMGPASVLKFGLGPMGAVLYVIAVLLIWLWSVLLFGLALMSTYRMTVERALIVLATPFVAQLILFGWLLGFWSHISQLTAHL